MDRTCRTMMSSEHVRVLFPIPLALYLVVASLFVLFLVALSPFFPFRVAPSRVVHARVRVAHVRAVHVALAHASRVPVAPVPAAPAPVRVLVALALAHVRVRVHVPFLAFVVRAQQTDRPLLGATDLVGSARAMTTVRRTCAMDSHNMPDVVECDEHQSRGTSIVDPKIRHIVMHLG